MKGVVRTNLLLGTILVLISGCQQVLSQEDDYLKSRTKGSLTVPGNLARDKINDNFLVPESKVQHEIEIRPSLVPPGSLLDIRFNPQDVNGARPISQNEIQLKSGDNPILIVNRRAEVVWPSVASGLYHCGFAITHRDLKSMVYTAIAANNPKQQQILQVNVVPNATNQRVEVSIQSLTGKPLNALQKEYLLEQLHLAMGQQVASNINVSSINLG